MGSLHVVFSAGDAAGTLWAYGEDDLADVVLGFAEDEMVQVWQRATRLSDPAAAVPVTGRHVSNGHVIAFACIEQIEGRLRPLKRHRRRPDKDMPVHIRNGPGLPPMDRLHELLDEARREPDSSRWTAGRWWARLHPMRRAGNTTSEASRGWP